MAHIRLEWVPERYGELDVVLVDVKVGPARTGLRDAGRLQMHASELNALDRLLHTGETFQRPAITYEIVNLMNSARAEDFPFQPILPRGMVRSG